MYCSTILLTEEEHKNVTVYTKNTEIMNYVAYDKVGIEVKGLNKIIDYPPVFEDLVYL